LFCDSGAGYGARPCWATKHISSLTPGQVTVWQLNRPASLDTRVKATVLTIVNTTHRQPLQPPTQEYCRQWLLLKPLVHQVGRIVLHVGHFQVSTRGHFSPASARADQRSVRGKSCCREIWGRACLPRPPAWMPLLPPKLLVELGVTIEPHYPHYAALMLLPLPRPLANEWHPPITPSDPKWLHPLFVAF
jgi:hypothetical protein